MNGSRTKTFPSVPSSDDRRAASQAVPVYLLAGMVGGAISALFAFVLSLALPWVFLVYLGGGICAVVLIALVLSFRRDVACAHEQFDPKSWRTGYGE